MKIPAEKTIFVPEIDDWLEFIFRSEINERLCKTLDDFIPSEIEILDCEEFTYTSGGRLYGLLIMGKAVYVPPEDFWLLFKHNYIDWVSK